MGATAKQGLRFVRGLGFVSILNFVFGVSAFAGNPLPNVRWWPTAIDWAGGEVAMQEGDDLYSISFQFRDTEIQTSGYTKTFYVGNIGLAGAYYLDLSYLPSQHFTVQPGPAAVNPWDPQPCLADEAQIPGWQGTYLAIVNQPNFSQFCSMRITFHPQAAGLHAIEGGLRVFFISETDRLSNPDRTFFAPAFQVSGRGLNTRAHLALTPASAADVSAFGDVEVGQSRVSTFNLTNIGIGEATQIQWSGLSEPFTVLPDSSCLSLSQPRRLAPNASCQLRVSFAPSAAGPITRNLAVNYLSNGQGMDLVQAFSGNGVVPANPARLAFQAQSGLAIDGGTGDGQYGYGSVVQGQSAGNVTFVVRNEGGLAATGVNFDLTNIGGNPNFTFSAGSCAAGALIAGGQCDFAVAYHPVSAGPHAAQALIRYQNGVGNQRTLQLSVSGTGIAATASLVYIDAVPAAQQVAVGTSISVTLQIRNQGNAAATALVLPANPAGERITFSTAAANPCGVQLAAQATCNLQVNFTANAASAQTVTLQDYVRAFDVGYADAFSAPRALSRSLTFTSAHVQPLLVANPATLAFGNVDVATTRTLSLQIRNLGLQPTVGLNFPAVLLDRFSVVSNGCLPQVAGQGVCNVAVRFAPASLGVYSDLLQIRYRREAGDAEQSVSVALSGTGIYDRPFLVLSPSLEDFGSVPMQSQSERILRLVNQGNRTAYIHLMSYSPADYSGVGGSCTTAIAAGASCEQRVRFRPASIGPSNGSLTVVYSASMPPRQDAGIFGDSVADPNRYSVEVAYDRLSPKASGGNGQVAMAQLRGVGTPPDTAAQLVLIPTDASSHDVGDVPYQDTADRSVSFNYMNVGGHSAEIQGVTVPIPFSIRSSTCQGVIAYLQTCTVIVGYANPVPAQYSGRALAVAYRDAVTLANASKVVNLSIRFAGALLAQSPAGLVDFQGSVGGVLSAGFGLVNSGNVPAQALAIVGTPAGFSANGSACAALGESQACQVAASYNAASVGTFDGSYQIAYSYAVGGTVYTAAPVVIAARAVVSGDGGSTPCTGPLANRISTPADVSRIRANLLGTFEICADLDFSGIDFEPIGTPAAPFRGNIEGNGHVISNLTINRPLRDGAGFFGSMLGGCDPGTFAYVRNLRFVNVNVTGQRNVGTVAGDVVASVHFTNLHVESGQVRGVPRLNEQGAQVTATLSVGGLIGVKRSSGSYAEPAGMTQDVSSRARVTAEGTGAGAVGGLIGSNYKNPITGASVATELVDGGPGSFNVGGVIGFNGSWAQVADAHFTQPQAGVLGEVKGKKWVGGLIGNNQSNISDSSAQARVTGSALVLSAANPPIVESTYDFEGVGGLIGTSGGLIQNTSAGGIVTGVENVGGLIGDYAGAEITNGVSTAEVNGSTINAGGLVGRLFTYYAEAAFPSARITNSSASGLVRGCGGVGGLVGSVEGSIVTRSSASGAVEGGNCASGAVVDHGGYPFVGIGGAIGNVAARLSQTDSMVLKQSRIESVSASGTVTGSRFATGGALGAVVWSSVRHVYARGAVSLTAGGRDVMGGLEAAAGGLIGRMYTSASSDDLIDQSTLSDAYATGRVTYAGGYVSGQAYRLGALIGQLYVWTNGGISPFGESSLPVYWNASANTTIQVPSNASGGLTTLTVAGIGGNSGYQVFAAGRSDIQLQTQGTYAGWDFASSGFWQMPQNGDNGGFPTLR
ncbi:MAG: choice-of-anchor D domain-containing protein [Bacteriovoracia bacterium]